jgi:hypothetical protein
MRDVPATRQTMFAKNVFNGVTEERVVRAMSYNDLRME